MHRRLAQGRHAPSCPYIAAEISATNDAGAGTQPGPRALTYPDPELQAGGPCAAELLDSESPARAAGALRSATYQRWQGAGACKQLIEALRAHLGGTGGVSRGVGCDRPRSLWKARRRVIWRQQLGGEPAWKVLQGSRKRFSLRQAWL